MIVQKIVVLGGDRCQARCQKMGKDGKLAQTKDIRLL